MLPFSPTDWPFRQEGNFYRRQGNPPAIFRHDIAQARYLERQCAQRIAAAPGINLPTVAYRLLALLRPIGATLSRRRAGRGPASPLRL